MKCKHENTPVDTHLIRESLTCDGGGTMVARRQCSMCNQTLEEQRPLPKDFDENGFDAFYDWDVGSWEPASQHEAYQQRQLAKITPPPEASEGPLAEPK